MNVLQHCASSSAGSFLFAVSAMALLHPAIRAALTAEASAELESLGIDSVADLAARWTIATDVFDASAELGLVESLTRAWQTARRLEGIPIYLHCRCGLLLLSQLCLLVHGLGQGVCLQPLFCRSLFRVISRQRSLRALQRHRRRSHYCLDMMFQVATRSAGSSNARFGAELAQLPQKSRSSFERPCSQCLPKPCIRTGVPLRDGRASIACIAPATARTGNLRPC